MPSDYTDITEDEYLRLFPAEVWVEYLPTSKKRFRKKFTYEDWKKAKPDQISGVEAEALFNKDRKTLYNWEKRHGLKPLRVGKGERWYHKCDIVELANDLKLAKGTRRRTESDFEGGVPVIIGLDASGNQISVSQLEQALFAAKKAKENAAKGNEPKPAKPKAVVKPTGRLVAGLRMGALKHLRSASNGLVALADGDTKADPRTVSETLSRLVEGSFAKLLEPGIHAALSKVYSKMPNSMKAAAKHRSELGEAANLIDKALREDRALVADD